MPSSRHLKCPACRARTMCTCGRVKQAKSEQCGACRSVAKEANGNWKGGRTRHKAGYVMVRVPDHPRVKKSPYVFEHILVAEQQLGRYLEPGESVHHRNGIRDDNRPENLELWTSPQPAGIRVSDAIAWAVEILERYTDWGAGAPPTALSDAKALLEVAGVEPASSERLVGLLRAQPVKRSRATAAHRRCAAAPASVECPEGPCGVSRR
jgi:hypothetical protein